MLNALNSCASALGAVIFAALALGVFISVFFRYALADPFGWTEEVTRFFLVWGVMLGMGYTLQQGRHIRVTTLVKNLSLKNQRLIEFFGDLLAICVLSIFAYKSYEFVAFTKMIGELSQGSLSFPVWWAELALPIGGGLFIFQYLIKSLMYLLGYADDYAAAGSGGGH